MRIGQNSQTTQQIGLGYKGRCRNSHRLTVFWSKASHTTTGTTPAFTDLPAVMLCKHWGLLVTERMEKAGFDPLGFVSTDYAVLIWGLNQLPDPAKLFDGDNLREAF